MLSTRRHRRDFGFSGEASQMTALALFVILLSFFMMLSGMAGVFLKNSDAVFESVREAFGVPDVVVLEGSGASFIKSPISRAGQGTSLQDIAGSFQNEVPGIRAVLVRNTGQLQIDIPINEMNSMTGLSGTDGISPVIQTLISFLADPTRKSYQVTIQVNERPETDDRLSGKSSTISSIYDLFLLKWASVFIQSGLPSDRLQVGVGVGHPGVVTLIIRPLDQGNK